MPGKRVGFWVSCAFLLLAACGAVEGNGSIFDAGPTPDARIDGGGDDCGNGQLDPGEECDGEDLGRRTCQSEGFQGGDLACKNNCEVDVSACLTPETCNNGQVDEGEDCDGELAPGVDCASLGFAGGTLECGQGCAFDTSECTHCGNLTIQDGEDCDGTNLNNMTCGSLPGFEHGDLACGDDCQYDTTGCGFCGDGKQENGEACDGTDFGGKTCESEGFASGSLECEACQLDTSMCVPKPNCPNGMIDSGEDCDGALPPGATCSTAAPGLPQGTLTCSAACQFDTSACYKCGDGLITAGQEVCDGTNFGGKTCLDFPGYDGGSLGCTADCKALDSGNCTKCGDGVQEGGEKCDGTDLNGQTCQTVGNYEQGTLKCTSQCKFDESACIHCGDGVAEGTEACDGADLKGKKCTDFAGYNGGTLKCGAGCALDFSQCTKPASCGNGTVETGEDCEGTTIPTGKTCASETGNTFPTGTLSCVACKFDKSNCYKCGDNALHGPEKCDGTNLGSQTCVSQGFDGGTLACNNTCLGFVTTGCSKCGNNMLESGEKCDGTQFGGKTCLTEGEFSGGTLSCNACSIVTTGCFGPPTVPKLRRPLHGAFVSTRRPQLVWYASTVAGGASIVYDIQYSPDASFPAAATTTVEGIAGGLTSFKPTVDVPMDPNPPVGRLFWRVQARAGNAKSGYSAPSWLFVGRTEHDMNGDLFADLAAGSPFFGNNLGRAQLWLGPAINTPIEMKGVADNNQAGAALEAGDFNGDGYWDLAVGLPGFSPTGRISVYLGGATFNNVADVNIAGTLSASMVTAALPAPSPNPVFGRVMAVGDFNGDGFHDLVAGTMPGDTGGRVDVYMGGPNNSFNNTSDRNYVGQAGGTKIGMSVGASDVNGDGFTDLLIEELSPEGACLESCNSATRLYLGSASGLPASSPHMLFTSQRPTGLGDVDGDGIADFLLDGFLDALANWWPLLRLGNASVGAFAGTALAKPTGHNGSNFGSQRAHVGDVDGTSFSDFLVTDPSNGGGRGAWYLFTNGNTSPTLQVEGTTVPQLMGASVCGGGDVNGDGIADWAVGAASENGPALSEPGRVRVYFGASAPGGLNNVEDRTVTGTEIGERLGDSCSL